VPAAAPTAGTTAAVATGTTAAVPAAGPGTTRPAAADAAATGSPAADSASAGASATHAPAPGAAGTATHGPAPRHRSAANRRAAAGVSPAVPTPAATPADPPLGLFSAHIPARAVPTVVVPAVALAVIGVLRLVDDLDSAKRSAHAGRIGARPGGDLVDCEPGNRKGRRRDHRPQQSCH